MWIQKIEEEHAENGSIREWCRIRPMEIGFNMKNSNGDKATEYEFGREAELVCHQRILSNNFETRERRITISWWFFCSIMESRLDFLPLFSCLTVTSPAGSLVRMRSCIWAFLKCLQEEANRGNSEKRERDRVLSYERKKRVREKAKKKLRCFYLHNLAWAWALRKHARLNITW